MGCTTSHEVFTITAGASRALSSSSSWTGRWTDPASLCRERATLIHVVANRRFAHPVCFRSLTVFGDALRHFTATALMPIIPPSGSSSVLTLPPSSAKPRQSSGNARTSSPSVADRSNGSGNLSSTLEKLSLFLQQCFPF
ncbi:hypothetical protein GUJ93_ZPchr0008g12112 [Zizania palustris]|uniref:Uncharacterized protein n=1 Tax=Zizania palustris TaxID=103762 RepID=A0A8J5V0Y3_ZIZPA|nr:hypothetical protein GUJ93_ZPchr0008g12112 [Zizania palustris]